MLLIAKATLEESVECSRFVQDILYEDDFHLLEIWFLIRFLTFSDSIPKSDDMVTSLPTSGTPNRNVSNATSLYPDTAPTPAINRLRLYTPALLSVVYVRFLDFSQRPSIVLFHSIAENGIRKTKTPKIMGILKIFFLNAKWKLEEIMIHDNAVNFISKLIAEKKI